MTTDTVYLQDLHQLEPKGHMFWLPPEKLTVKEKEAIQEFKQRKATLLGKYQRCRYNS